MTLGAFCRLVRREYKTQNGERFFTEKALISALLEKNKIERSAPLCHPDRELSPAEEKSLAHDLARLLCGEPMQYLTDKPYRYCPYCGSEVTERKVAETHCSKRRNAKEGV